MNLIPLSEFGLMTTTEVAEYHGCAASTVEGWIGKGYLRAVPVGARCYLVTRADCETFTKPRPGPRGPWKHKPARGKRKAPPAPVTVPLSRFGLATVKQFAKRHRRAEQTVLRWIAEERFPAVPVRTRSLPCYLLRLSDCEAFRPPKMGPPPWEDGATR